MRRIAVTAALVASGWVAWAATGLPEGGVLRAVVLTVFLLLGPGAAAVRLRAATPGDSRAVRAVEAAVLVLVLSLTFDTLVAVGFFLDHRLDSTRAVGVLAALTTVLALLAHRGGLRRTGRRRTGSQDSGGPPTGRPTLARSRR